MTAIAIDRPARIPSWVGWLVSGLLGLGAMFTVITSNTFQVDVGPIPAFPGCEGFGCDTVGGRGGVVCIVTNTNSTGAGSFTDCLMDTSPRIIVFYVSGVIATANEINPALAQSNVTVLGQTAPGDGIMLKPAGQERIFRLGQFETPSNAFTDGIFQHLRMRLVPGIAGGQPGPSNTGQDTFLIGAGSHHIVFDHCDSIWTSDESFNIVGSSIHDITFSRMIIGEAGPPQNYGGGLHTVTTAGGEGQWNITYHHNLFIHTEQRHPITSANGRGVANEGNEYINNINYNHSSASMTLLMFNGSSTPGRDMLWDYQGNFEISGPSGTPLPITAYYLQHPQSFWGDYSIHMIGNTWREVNGTHVNNPLNDTSETNNYTMINKANPDGQGPPVITERSGKISPQPIHPVTVQHYNDAYASILTDGDVGALPHDAHTARLVLDPVDGSGYNVSLIPPPFGSGNVSFVTFGAPTDTDNDGVPDAYETLIGTDPNVFENQAVLDSDGDGFVNIEDWAHSLTDRPTP